MTACMIVFHDLMKNEIDLKEIGELLLTLRSSSKICFPVHSAALSP